MPTDQPCEELNRIRLEAVAAFQAAKQTRRSRDLSFQEDVELSRDEHRKISLAAATKQTTHPQRGRRV